MKILITGSEGSLMQAVIPKLIQQGHEIIGVDNFFRHGIPDDIDNKPYRFKYCDLTDRSKTFDLFQEQYDAVFLAAAKIYGVGGLEHFCADIISDDAAIQGNILQACARYGVNHVVYISSSMVYESSIQEINYALNEDLINNCIVPKSEYGLTKLFGERVCQAFKKQYNIDYTIWRPFNIVNPKEYAMSTRGFSHVIADYIENIIIKKCNPLPIIGDGEQIRCFTWIDDVANIISNFSFNENAKNQIFNICNVEPITMKTLANKIYRYTNNTQPLEFVTVSNYPNDVKIRIPSVKKLLDIIGDYKFKTVDDCIAECVKIPLNTNNPLK